MPNRHEEPAQEDSPVPGPRCPSCRGNAQLTANLVNTEIQNFIQIRTRVEIRFVSATNESAKSSSGSQNTARRECEQVQRPGCQETAAAPGDLPRADFTFADPVRFISREHVMQVVIPDCTYPSRGIRKRKRKWPQLEANPTCPVPAIGSETGLIEVPCSRITHAGRLCLAKLPHERDSSEASSGI